MGGDELGPWEPLDPVEARDLFVGLDVPWWVAGGWAIDLGLGRTTRNHGDIDVEVLRRDQFVVQGYLQDRGWELFLANRVLTPWISGEPAPAATSDVWCRPEGSPSWTLQLMLNLGDDETWVSKRDTSITLPMDVAVRRSADGVPFLVAEAQLLMKAKNRLPKDDVDFANAAGTLDDEARAWLRAGIERLHPGHGWLDELA